MLLFPLPLMRCSGMDRQRLAERKEEPVKYFSLVTEILGGPQAETVKARKEEQGVNIDHPNLLSNLTNAAAHRFNCQ